MNNHALKQKFKDADIAQLAVAGAAVITAAFKVTESIAAIRSKNAYARLHGKKSNKKK